MARNKMQEEEQDIVIKGPKVTAVEEKFKEEQQKRELISKRNKFAQSQEDLKAKMFMFAEKYGIEDYRTQLMMEFYDVSVQLSETIETVESIVTVTDMLFKGIEFFDDALSIFDNFFTQSLTQNYGPFQRIKDYFKRKRAERNLVNRMKSLSNSIATIQGFSTTIVTSIRSSVDQMKINMARNQAKREKEQKKLEAKGIVTSPVNTNSATAKMIADHLAEKGIEHKDPVTSGGGKPAGSTSGSDDDIF